MMLTVFGNHTRNSRCIALLGVVAVAAMFCPPVAGQFLVQQIGGIRVDASGVVSHVSEQNIRDLRRALRDSLTEVDVEINRHVEMRMVSVKGLEAELQKAMDSGQPIPDHVKFMAGLQRIENVFLYPETGDIVLAGPGEGWTVNDAGDVVGVKSELPVLRFEDFIIAMRTARAANEGYGITVSIDPTEEGSQRLRRLFRQVRRFNPQLADQVEQAMGPQQISLTGAPTTSRFANILVAADYHMKRLAMGFEPAPVDNMPSVLELARKSGRVSGSISPRFWLECNYEPVRKSENNLAWQIRGSGAKCLAGDKHDQSAKGVHKIAKQWAESMTEQFDELAKTDSVFCELRNIMDMAVVAALVQKQDMLNTVGLDLPAIMGDQKTPFKPWSTPKQVPTQCSFVELASGWLVTASGGIQLNSWSVAANTVTTNELGPLYDRAQPAGDQLWWN